ncbi:hypothetical protein [Filimonas effusa]|uniref:Uncharacterized protein n=1 Tax=Filimonas effusa TaxID=2508721 RepID=A0A4Q1D6C4_9BACT|nr:hypothetical protein [Filimonas effusa]RXK83423.1 hypothetical protein ESB13_15115 [Filimonas effusa]
MFSTLAPQHRYAMVKYIAIRMTVMVCYCYVFTLSANAQTPPAGSAGKKGIDTSAAIINTTGPANTHSEDSATVKLSRKARKLQAKADKRRNAIALAEEIASAASPATGLPGDSTSQAHDTTGSGKPANKGEITKLEDCEIPFEMAYNIKHMRPSEMDSLKIVFQKIVLEEQEEKIVTIRMRFSDDHIHGYMTKAPIHHSNKYVVVNMPINVKIQWCCTPDSTHPKHCAATFAEIKHLDSTEHCTRWTQTDDGTHMVEQVAAAKERIDKRSKKKKPFFGRVVEFFQFKPKEKYILIPVDKTFRELLKPPVQNTDNQHTTPTKINQF